MADPVELSWRAAALAALGDGPVDVLIAGGGIVGAGICRDAALRGLQVGLCEQHDFAFGTSSRSSRLLHGGIRYLAQGHIGLVCQASREKRVIERIAPHLAAPLAFVFPTYRGTAWPYWKLRVGVKLYDLLSGAGDRFASSAIVPGRLHDRFPALVRDGLTGAVRYFDAVTNDARLVLDTLRSAAVHGAAVCNYCRLETADFSDGVWRCQVRDRLDDREYLITALCLVNACGPWAGRLPGSRLVLRPTKGVHLVVDRARLPVAPSGDGQDAEAIIMTDARRVVYLIPWGQRTFIGTTDTDYRGSLDEVRTEAEDVRYLLALVNRYFPAAELTEADVLRTWAGVRLLVPGRCGAPSDAPRTHQIRMSGDGWIDVAGGKLTTYRLMAEQVTDRICRRLHRCTPSCRTGTLPLLDADLVGPASRIVPPPVTRTVVEHCCKHEWAVHLEDVMVRCTHWHTYHCPDGPIADQVAAWMAAALGWSNPRTDQELVSYRRLVD